MEVNINSKRKPYEVGDLIEVSGFISGTGFRMIINNNNNQYFLINMEGRTTTPYYDSIEELLEKRNILNHYKNNDLEISLKRKQRLY